MSTITIARAGYKLGSIKEKSAWGRSRKTKTDTAPARIISTHLAIYKHQEQTSYTSARWHVIHIPTGYVIADIEYEDVSTVKQTFESSLWTLSTDQRGDVYFNLVDDRFTFELYPRIQYTIERAE